MYKSKSFRFNKGMLQNQRYNAIENTEKKCKYFNSGIISFYVNQFLDQFIT